MGTGQVRVERQCPGKPALRHRQVIRREVVQMPEGSVTAVPGLKILGALAVGLLPLDLCQLGFDRSRNLLRDVLEHRVHAGVLDGIALVPEQPPAVAVHQLRVDAPAGFRPCLLYTSDAADERSSVDLGGRRIIKKKKKKEKRTTDNN